jgi:adenosine deaminase
MTRREHLQRLIREVIEDAAADGVVWVQPHFDPYAYPDFDFGSAEEVLELTLAAGYEAGARHGVGFGLTLAAMRHHGPDAAATLARFGARYAGRGVHAFGLAGDEALYATERFASAFDLGWLLPRDQRRDRPLVHGFRLRARARRRTRPDSVRFPSRT